MATLHKQTDHDNQTKENHSTCEAPYTTSQTTKMIEDLMVTMIIEIPNNIINTASNKDINNATQMITNATSQAKKEKKNSTELTTDAKGTYH